jgi:hypothetical protein
VVRVDQLKVMKAAAQGAKAENVDLGVATDALSTVMLDYHLKRVEGCRDREPADPGVRSGEDELRPVLRVAVERDADRRRAGCQFAEIGGAIATMTQHGVSAQRATENLRNLLFNLSGQNNVASQAMQQLGIDTVDLAKNLGKRGLTGTLAIVDKALQGPHEERHGRHRRPQGRGAGDAVAVGRCSASMTGRCGPVRGC